MLFRPSQRRGHWPCLLLRSHQPRLPLPDQAILRQILETAREIPLQVLNGATQVDIAIDWHALIWLKSRTPVSKRFDLDFESRR